MSATDSHPVTLLLCDCLKSQTLDPEAISAATGFACSQVHTELCGAQAEQAAQALSTGNAIVCCGQEHRFFEDLAEEIGADSPLCIDLRDRAGWTDPAATASDPTPKMAALLAEATLPIPPIKTLDVESEGLCLIIGQSDIALHAAERLKDVLGLTVLLTDDTAAATDLPESRAFEVIRGRLASASGALGGFELRINALQQTRAGGRGALQASAPQDGAQTECDIILDLSGGTPLFPAHEKRDGYLRADPGSAPAVANAIFEASQLVGTFEKPLYVRHEPSLCAHSRAEQVACTNCLDACPTSAISPAGDHVTIDPMICAGCGSCAALCPSGAMIYEAPQTDFLFSRVQTLARTYLNAGGTDPHLLAVDAHGSEMIRLLARHGRGLPANVIPVEVSALNTFGHAEILAALAAGFSQVSLVPGPGTEREALDREMTLALAIAGPGRLHLLDTPDPDLLGDALYGAPNPAPWPTQVRPMGSRRQITRQAARALQPQADVIPLPDTAPYGAVLVDTQACTLCLSCVSLCPSGALGDNPDLPQLRFQEDACLQCGLCAGVCPEDAITYEPRLDLTPQALEQSILNEEEPFACIDCGTLFGSRSTIERITEKLAAHSMYQGEGALRMIQMCDNCRVNAQFHSENNPFQGAERPRPRTTEDYLSKRRDH